MRLHFSFPYCNIQDVVPQFPIKCSVEWVDAEDPLFLLYTSGSTGKPKAPNYPDSGRCWDIVDKYKVTIFYTAPTLVRSLMRESDEVITLGDKDGYFWLTGRVDDVINVSYFVDLLTKRISCQIGAFAAPDKIHWAPGLPKTRSGKIMRRILRKIASGQLDELGDTSTLADPSVVDQLIALRDC
ncbi:hypothetical protein BHM03_00049459 [Ensete ventricosum]|nr:hypothetical protein BHM03_00049459 [Ensete ventricosum]